MSEAVDPLAESADLDARRVGGPSAGTVAAVAVGGAVGAPARYGLTEVVGVPSGAFPWGTFTVNVSGSLALGVLLTLLTDYWKPPWWARPLITTGFVGAYTTWSTFAVETDLLVRAGRTPVAVGYVVASLAAGLMAVWLGMVVARAVGHRARPAP